MIFEGFQGMSLRGVHGGVLRVYHLGCVGWGCPQLGRIFLMRLYSGGEVWEGIWNHTHLVVLNFYLERLHHVTISHDKARSNRWCH